MKREFSGESPNEWRTFFTAVLMLCSTLTKVSAGQILRRVSSSVTSSPGRSRGPVPISVAGVQPEPGAVADPALFLFSTGFGCGESYTRPGRKRVIWATEKSNKLVVEAGGSSPAVPE